MKVTTKDVEYIAQLSRLTIPEGEMEKFTEQFNQILNPPQTLRDDFPDSLDGRIFSLDDEKNNTKNQANNE